MKFRQKATACASILLLSSGFSSAMAKQEIKIWYENTEPQYQAAFQELFIEPFNASQDEYTVSMEYYNGIGVKTQMGLLANQDTFDIFMTEGPSILKRLTDSGKVEPLDAYVKQYGWDKKYQEVMLDTLNFDGVQYGLPKTFESLALFYNKRVFAENGWVPPTNAEELKVLAEKMLAKDIIPLAAGNEGWRGANEWYTSAVKGSCLSNKQSTDVLTGELAWTSPEIKKSFEIVDHWFKNWFPKKDYFSLNLDKTTAGIGAGEYGMMVNGTWAFQFLEAGFADQSEVGVVPLPALCDDAVYPSYAIAVGASLSINKNSKNKDGAALVLDKLLSKEVFVDMATAWPGEWLVPLEELPLTEFKAAVDAPFYEHVTGVVDAMDKGNIGFASWTFYPPKTRQFMIDRIENVWLGKWTMEKFLKDLDKTFQRELKKGDVPKIPTIENI